MKTQNLNLEIQQTAFVNLHDEFYLATTWKVSQGYMNDFLVYMYQATIGYHRFFLVCPNRTSQMFAMLTLRQVYAFVTQYKNTHEDKFWFRRWRPSYSKAVVAADALRTSSYLI